MDSGWKGFGQCFHFEKKKIADQWSMDGMRWRNAGDMFFILDVQLSSDFIIQTTLLIL